MINFRIIGDDSAPNFFNISTSQSGTNFFGVVRINSSLETESLDQYTVSMKNLYGYYTPLPSKRFQGLLESACLSVCPSVCLYVCVSICVQTNRIKKLKFQQVNSKVLSYKIQFVDDVISTDLDKAQ